MSNPLYDQVKEKVEASSLSLDQFTIYPLNFQETMLEAERMRSLAIAGAFAQLFGKLFATVGLLRGSVDRARTANRLSAMDEPRLAKFGVTRTDLPGFVAGYVEDAQISLHRAEVRQAVQKAA